MKSDKSRHREFSSGEISEILTRYRSSGLGAMRFAQEEGIPRGRMHYWIYQKGRGKPQELSRPSVSTPRFHEVKVATVVPGVANWVAEVSLPRGIAVRLGSAATPEWIGAVVEVLQRSC